VTFTRGLAAVLVAAAFFVQAHAASPEAQTQRAAGAHADGPHDSAEIQRLTAEGESALAAGDTAAAERAFERAALMTHSADVEMGLVRTYMQAGDYRHALTFASHAAGAHRNVPAGTALYAWLLHIGGQNRIAATMLTEAAQRSPEDPVLRQARTSLSNPWPVVSGALAQAPGRTAPYAWGAAVPESARALGSGVLIEGGRAALVPAKLLDQAQRVWIRNGLGETVEATVERRMDALALTLLRAAHPLRSPPPMQRLPREPFGGSPGYTFEYTPGPGHLAAWPLTRAGFFGSVPRDDGPRPLGIDVPPGPRGGPVFDAAGRLVGIAVTDSAGDSRIVFASRLGTEAGADGADAVSSVQSPRMPVDEIYERALTAAVQVIVVE
jgi:hypothetical protein